MKSLWTYIDKKNWNINTKYRVALFIFGILYALAGFCVWFIIKNIVLSLSSRDWMLCFIGYPAIISCLIVFLYDSDHRFHDNDTME